MRPPGGGMIRPTRIRVDPLATARDSMARCDGEAHHSEARPVGRASMLQLQPSLAFGGDPVDRRH